MNKGKGSDRKIENRKFKNWKKGKIVIQTFSCTESKQKLLESLSKSTTDYVIIAIHSYFLPLFQSNWAMQFLPVKACM